jgi:hypothetical protein
MKCQLTDDNHQVWLIKIVSLITVLEIATIITDVNNNKIITFKAGFEAEAFHLITTNLSPEKTLSVKFCSKAQEMWDLLNEDAQGKDQARGVTKLLELVNFVNSGKSMREELSKMKTLVMDVTAAMGSKDISIDKLGMLIFAYALSSGYSVQRSQILREMKSFDEIEQLLLQEEKFQRGTKPASNGFAGFTGTPSGGGKKRSWPEGTELCEHNFKKSACNKCPGNSRENQKCANCHESGHRTYYSMKCKQYRPHPDPRFQAKPPINYVDGMSK